MRKGLLNIFILRLSVVISVDASAVFTEWLTAGNSYLTTIHRSFLGKVSVRLSCTRNMEGEHNVILAVPFDVGIVMTLFESFFAIVVTDATNANNIKMKCLMIKCILVGIVNICMTKLDEVGQVVVFQYTDEYIREHLMLQWICAEFGE